MNFVVYISGILFTLFVLRTEVNCQTPTLEVLLETFHEHGNGVSYTASVPNAASIFRSGKKLCVRGLWALYTKPNYGNANIGDVTVYTVKAGNGFECTGSTNVGSILRQIWSFRVIAPVAEEYCNNKYFLSPCSTLAIVDPPAPFPWPVRSFALRGTGLYQICNDVAQQNCYCLDTRENGPYMVPDLAHWPNDAQPFNQITALTIVTRGSDDEQVCRQFGPPPA